MIDKEKYETMEKLLKRCELLEKKEKLWGISSDEEKELAEKKIEYLQLYYMCIDDLYLEFIEPLLFTDDIIDIKQEILAKSQWEGNLLFKQNDIEQFLDDVDNYEELICLIEELEAKEIFEIKNLNNEIYNILDCFCDIEELCNINNIIKYIKLRNEIMITILSGDDLECD